MVKLSQNQIFRKKSWLLIGILLSLAIIGVGGCGSKTETSTPAAATTQSSTSDTSSASGTQSSTSNEDNQGQTAQPALNPAIDATMGIRRLLDNQEMALTRDQKDKLKPILQELIDTSTPSQEFLQQKADAIKAVFTDQQKNYLSTNTHPKGPNGNSQNGIDQPKDQPNERPQGQKGGPNNDQATPSFQPQDIYKQVLASLT